LLTPERAAEILGIDVSVLGWNRTRAASPAYIKFTDGKQGHVRYIHQDLIDFLNNPEAYSVQVSRPTMRLRQPKVAQLPSPTAVPAESRPSFLRRLFAYKIF
jgi:hypothetical protein